MNTHQSHTHTHTEKRELADTSTQQKRRGTAIPVWSTPRYIPHSIISVRGSSRIYKSIATHHLSSGMYSKGVAVRVYVGIRENLIPAHCLSAPPVVLRVAQERLNGPVSFHQGSTRMKNKRDEEGAGGGKKQRKHRKQKQQQQRGPGQQIKKAPKKHSDGTSGTLTVAAAS